MSFADEVAAGGSHPGDAASALAAALSTAAATIAGEAGVLDPDGRLAANSDAKVATQKAVKEYVDAHSGGGGGGSGITWTVVDANAAGSSYTPLGGENTWYKCDTSGGDIAINYPASPVEGDLLRVSNVTGGGIVTGPGEMVVTPQAGAEAVYDGTANAYWLTGSGANGGTTRYSVVQLDASAKLPAVDGSQLTGLPAGGGLARTAIGNSADPNTFDGSTGFTAPAGVVKKITLPTGGLVLGVSFAVFEAVIPQRYAVAIASDNSGSPGAIISSGESALLGDGNGDGNFRWASAPIAPIWLPAGDYWVSVCSAITGTSVTMLYKNTGADKNMTGVDVSGVTSIRSGFGNTSTGHNFFIYVDVLA